MRDADHISYLKRLLTSLKPVASSEMLPIYLAVIVANAN